MVLAVLQALSMPTVDAVVRSEWKRLARDDREVRSLHTVDSILEESGYLLGPVLVGAVTLVGSSAAALYTVCWLTVLGSLVIFTPRSMRTALGRPVVRNDGDPQSSHSSSRVLLALRTVLGPIASPVLRQIVLPLILMGCAFGFAGLLIPMSAEAYGDSAISGFLFGAISFGGVIGALGYGALRLRAALSVRQAALTVANGAPLILLAASWTPQFLAAVLAVAGLAVTPMYINSYLMMDADIPESIAHEANVWVPVGYNLGYTLGITVAGLIATDGVGVVAQATAIVGLIMTVYGMALLVRSWVVSGEFRTKAGRREGES